MSHLDNFFSENSIAALARRVSARLSALSSASFQRSASNSDQGSELSYENEIARFDLWKFEQKVDHGGLDHELRETAEYREVVSALLNEIIELPPTTEPDLEPTLLEHQGPQGSVNPSWDSEALIKNHMPDCNSASERLLSAQRSKDISTGEEDTKLRQAATSDTSSIDTNVTFESVPCTPLIRLHDILSTLLKLGPLLSNPGPHDRLQYYDHPDAGKYDVEHVVEKYALADPRIATRIGRENWERRQCQRNLMLRHDKSASHTQICKAEVGLLSNEDDSSVTSSSSSGPRSATSLQARRNSLQVDDVAESLSSSSLLSERSASARASTASFQFSRTHSVLSTATAPSERQENPDVKPKVLPQQYLLPRPPLPNQDFTGEQFLCPYCFHYVSNIKSMSEWRNHIHQDIQPYVCTYIPCIASVKTFGNKSDWWQHEKVCHRGTVAWICKMCAGLGTSHLFRSKSYFEAHLQESHSMSLRHAQLINVEEALTIAADAAPPRALCPLCKTRLCLNDNNVTSDEERAMKDHIAHHLEQLAYFAILPPGRFSYKEADTEFQDDSDTDEEQEFKEEIKSVASYDTHLSMKDINQEKVRDFISRQQNVMHQQRLVPEHSHRTAVETKPTSKDIKSNNTHATPNFPIELLLHPPNEHFYARAELLANSATILSESGTICIFQGVGGVGKTLAAVEYVWQTKKHYDAVFWVQADTAPGRSDAYHQMAVALCLIDSFEDQNQIMDKCRTWLQDTDHRWLLIFDNALHWSDIADFLPNDLSCTKGSVLITTQHKSFAQPSANITVLPLSAMTREAGGEMLLRYLNRPVETDPERHLAKEISTFVGGLPVAIAHVAGYCEFSDLTLVELIQVFRQWRTRAGIAVHEEDELPLVFREASFSYDDALAMVWNITLRELTEDASDLMNVLAFLNCEAIPESMIWGLYEDQLLQSFDKREAFRITRIKRSLTKRRLVQMKTIEGQSCFSMHRSLQRGIQEKLSHDSGKQQKVFEQAVTLVRQVFPRGSELQQPTPDQWNTSQHLLPHLHVLRDVYYKSNGEIKGSVDFAELLTDAGMDQFERSITKDSLLLFKLAEEVLDRGWPQGQQAMRANIHAIIAIMYDNIGITQRQEAYSRRKTALDIRRSIVNATATPRRQDEILLYNSEMEFAISLLHYHRFTEAEPRIQKCLSKYREWGTEQEYPFEYAKYYNKIAIVRLYQGRFAEAIKLGSRSVTLMEKTGYTLFESRFKFDLACIVLQSGDYRGALKIHHQILEHRLQKLGKTSELTLHSFYAVGAIYEHLGELDTAIKWYRKVLEQRRNLTSWPDEAYSRAQFRMAQVLLAKPDSQSSDMAQMLLERSRRVLYRLLPLDTPPELENVHDEGVLFDHMLPVSPGGARFTGLGLLQYFMKPRRQSR